jgi:hypothetical protein
MLRTSSALTGAKAGCSVEESKLEEDSGSRASMLMVRQLSFSVALLCCCIIDMMAALWRGSLEEED